MSAGILCYLENTDSLVFDKVGVPYRTNKRSKAISLKALWLRLGILWFMQGKSYLLGITVVITVIEPLWVNMVIIVIRHWS